MAELKPCPFCGGEAEIVENGEARSNKYYFVDVSCKNTNCRGYTSSLEFKTKSKAIEAWNRRAEDGSGYSTRKNEELWDMPPIGGFHDY